MRSAAGGEQAKVRNGSRSKRLRVHVRLYGYKTVTAGFVRFNPVANCGSPERGVGGLRPVRGTSGQGPLYGRLPVWQGTILACVADRLQFYIRPVDAGVAPAGPDGISRSAPHSLHGLVPRGPFRFRGSRSDLFAITPCRSLRNLQRTGQCAHWPDDFVRPQSAPSRRERRVARRAGAKRRRRSLDSPLAEAIRCTRARLLT